LEIALCLLLRYWFFRFIRDFWLFEEYERVRSERDTLAELGDEMIGLSADEPAPLEIGDEAVVEDARAHIADQQKRRHSDNSIMGPFKAEVGHWNRQEQQQQ
jgi:hypothetical protein